MTVTPEDLIARHRTRQHPNPTQLAAYMRATYDDTLPQQADERGAVSHNGILRIREAVQTGDLVDRRDVLAALDAYLELAQIVDQLDDIRAQAWDEGYDWPGTRDENPHRGES